MTRKERSIFYTGRKADFSSQLSIVTKKINNISNARIFTAVVFIVLIYLGLTQPLLLYFLPLLLIAFILMVRNHGHLFDQKQHLENLVRINDQELKAQHGSLTFPDQGNKFTDPHHPYTHDLDIFGEGSLYHHINRSNTLAGKEKFAHRLANPLPTAEEIKLTQEAVKELSGKTDFRQHFQAAGMEIDENPNDRKQLLHWIKQKPFLFGKLSYRIILIAVPVITIALIIAAFFSDSFTPFAILMALLQWGFIGLHMEKIKGFHDSISRKKNILKKYARLLHYLQGQDFTASRTLELSGRAKDADRKVESLASLVSAFDARLNSMTILVVNSVLLYDLQCVYRLEKWKEENAADLDTWLDVISESEVLNSFGTFAFNHSGFTYASVNQSLSLSAASMGHPLIAESESVVNDFRIGDDQNVLIITGANMAGKSTFLRTIGVNLVLALNGAPVCAEEFNCPVIHLRTGMRTADSLKDHQSYFYAELDRLQGIMEDLRKEIPLLVLLDEILKGTNSTDKQAGSIALVKQFLPHPCLAIIATHDLALGELEKEYPGRIKNYCFEANIENDQLSFDYKLKPGLARKMNATFLMKKMGIIPA